MFIFVKLNSKLCSTYLRLELVLEGSVLKTFFAREHWLQAFAWETHQSQPGFIWPGWGDPFPDPTSVGPNRGASSPVTAVPIFWKPLSPFLPPKIKWTHREPKPLAQASEAPRTQLFTWPRGWERRGGEVLWRGAGVDRTKNAATGVAPVQWGGIYLWAPRCLFFLIYFLPHV